jgi:hypothetical protein
MNWNELFALAAREVWSSFAMCFALMAAEVWKLRRRMHRRQSAVALDHPTQENAGAAADKTGRVPARANDAR